MHSPTRGRRRGRGFRFRPRPSGTLLTHGEAVDHARAKALEGSRDALALDDAEEHVDQLPLSKAAAEPCLDAGPAGRVLVLLLVRSKLGARRCLQSRLGRVERVDEAGVNGYFCFGCGAVATDGPRAQAAEEGYLRVGEDGAEGTSEGGAEGGEGLLLGHCC